ncbi:39S ribosomal protein L1, mitochondrial, partial [Stegodyphus mimosarum]
MFTKRLFPVFTVSSAVLLKSTAKLNAYVTVDLIKTVPNLDLVRYAARKGTRAAALAKKKARKLQEANKPPPIPKYLQKKVKVSHEFERRRCTDENWLESQPIDNVWNMKLYRGKPYSVAEAIRMHRETHEPEILNNPSAFIYANIDLDLKLKKQNRFMDDFTGIISFPNEFETPQKNRIIAICKEPEDQAKASEAGAVYTGSGALIKQILSGAVSKEDFDYVVCHPDMLKELNVLRGILEKRFPNTRNGLLRLDVDKAVKNFIKGIEYKLKRSVIEPDFGWVDICFGQLNMPIEKLEENLKFALSTVEKHKPMGTDHILFIIRTLLWCEKSKEKFKIPHWEYLPNYPVNGILKDDDEAESEDMQSA